MEAPRKDTPDLDAFVRKVWSEGRKHHRDLAWRYIDDAYAVLVSEIMLQQTQVSRVEKYWPRFLKTFPTLDALASADTSLVLEHWQGLGYNRRALALKRTTEECALRFEGELPRTYDELLKLPGIGPATAGGVMAFAYQKPALYLETNVRTVFLHELFPHEEGVSDKTLEPLVLERGPARMVLCLARLWGIPEIDHAQPLAAFETSFQAACLRRVQAPKAR